MKTRATMHRASTWLLGTTALLVASSAQAQQLDVQQFQPAVGPHSAFSTEGARTVDAWVPTGGLLINYSSRPLVTVEEDADGDPVKSPIVDQQFALHALAGIGLFGMAQLDLDVPIYIVNEGDVPAEFSKAGLGDIRLRVKARLYGEEEGFGAGIAADLGLPTGSPERYVGAPSVTTGARLILDYDFGPLWIAFNGGIRYREEGQFGNNIDLGPAATFGLGAEFELLRGLVLLTGDIFGRTHTRDFFAGEDTPIEGMLGAKLIASHGITITGGAGGGFTSGAGAPAFRMLLGIGWAPREVDYDEDGILNDDDQCPDEAEDRDQFEDSDGCPEPDNDRDTIADEEDSCPNSPEDLDGFEDENGCPDLDNDGDGINDDADECRDEAEDADGFEDEDGCPEPDNDNDNIGDETDKCPMEPEDADGFSDSDGCPDLDNDNDKIPDTEDSCPNEPGLLEDNGCPPKETKAVREGTQIKILDKVFFETGEAIIKPESFGLLKQVGLILRTNDDIKLIEIAGHTDDRGRDAKNLVLSQRRAESVKNWLAEFGINATRLKAIGHGETKPLEKGRSKDARAANRRVEFNILDPAPKAAPAAEDAAAVDNKPAEPEKK